MIQYRHGKPTLNDDDHRTSRLKRYVVELRETQTLVTKFVRLHHVASYFALMYAALGN